MKTNKKLFAVIMSLTMLLSVIQPTMAAVVNYGDELINMPSKTYTQKFSDVPKSYWAFEYISEMVDRGVLAGYPDGKFYPNKNVSRAEFAKIMASAAGLSISYYSDTGYEDVSYNDWAAPYINAAKYYLSGYVSNGLKYYQPNNNALREDIAVALVKLKGYSTTGYDLSIIQTMFSDWQSISSAAQPYVAVAVEQCLISGYDDGTFKGQQGITRAEAATLLWRAYQYGNDNKVYEPEIMEKEEFPEITPEPEPEPTQKPIDKPDENDYKEPIDDVDEPIYEEDEEPEPEYGWKVSTIKNGISDMKYAQTVPNGLSYMISNEDNKVYEVNDHGKVTVIFDANEMRYLGKKELSKRDTVETQLYSYAYNRHDDCYYALIRQNPSDSYGYFLYNITNDDIIQISGSVDNKLLRYDSSTCVNPEMYFYENGDIWIGEADNNLTHAYITSSGNYEYYENSDVGRVKGFVKNNKIYGCYVSTDYIKNIDSADPNWGSRRKDMLLVGKDKFYCITYDKSEITSLDYRGDTKFLLSFDDILNEEGRSINVFNVIAKGAITDDESVIYFYDNSYGSIRKIERQ